MPTSPSSDDPDTPQSPFSRYAKFQSSVRAELTSYQFKVTSEFIITHVVTMMSPLLCCHNDVIITQSFSVTQVHKMRSNVPVQLGTVCMVPYH